MRAHTNFKNDRNHTFQNSECQYYQSVIINTQCFKIERDKKGCFNQAETLSHNFKSTERMLNTVQCLSIHNLLHY